MDNIEKTIILGALFHDIGKFEQRCCSNPGKKKHQVLGSELISSGPLKHRFEKIIGNENFSKLLNIINDHHSSNADELTKIVKEADHLSASERVEKEETEEIRDQWKNKHLCSLFSKIKLLNQKPLKLRYYKHELLTKAYDVIIPELEQHNLDQNLFVYHSNVFNDFKENMEYVLDVYQRDEDFDSLINLLLIVFEKYLWCIPDFTGSSETDISLYNHLKDVAGFAHSIYLTKKENDNKSTLNLVIGDIPGIQNYIFNVVNKKPAKILRGRSIFVQILSRNFATIFLKQLNLTEANLIMLAGGKFYIVAPDTDNFSKGYLKAKSIIENYLFENFRLDLSFNSAFHTFDFTDLMKKAASFGEIVENASHVLIKNRYNLFNKILFAGDREQNPFIIKEDYISGDLSDSNSIKCKVTDKPIRKGMDVNIQVPSEKGYENITVSKQVKAEFEIGDLVVDDNVTVPWNIEDLSVQVNQIANIHDYNGSQSNKTYKLLINPNLDELLKNKEKNIFNNTHYIQVANYCSKGQKENVMPFDEISAYNEGAEFLTLIKGDIDNLGLLMAYGLYDDKNDLSAVSRTTTLSNHLKYFFSFFLNGYLKARENQTENQKLYTIFAGGDDLMLITPQSNAINFIESFNKKFNEFVCENPEVHISYSVTHFKDHTPVRIVSGLAEGNQSQCKRKSNAVQFLYSDNPAIQERTFYLDNDKAGTYIFNTVIKNEELGDLCRRIDDLTCKAKEEKSGLSHGLIQKLLYLSEMLNKYEVSGDTGYLIAYARLSYSVKRLLKEKNSEVNRFFDHVLTINKEGNKEAQQIERMLYPLICQVIYNTRNKNGE